MSGKKRSASSSRWLQEHFNDKFVLQAQKQKLRSRAWFKLEELQQSDHLFKKGMTVIDLGAAPGGWSQYAAEIVGETGQVFACDILPMDALLGVNFIQGDFREQEILMTLLERIAGRTVQVVMSDMAPNMSGNPAVDIPRAMYLAELALEMCQTVLQVGGVFVVKVFHGEGFEEYLRSIRKLFKSVKIRKPEASRARSREVYIVAVGRKV